jgi:hypothetical protein
MSKLAWLSGWVWAMHLQRAINPLIRKAIAHREINTSLTEMSIPVACYLSDRSSNNSKSFQANQRFQTESIDLV